MKAAFLTILASLLLATGVNCENILFYVGGVSTYSHHTGFEPLANKLADLGHNVSFFSPAKDTSSHPNIKIYSPPELSLRFKTYMEEFGALGLTSRLARKYNNEIFEGFNFHDACLTQLEIIMTSPDFKRWVRTVQYDLIVIDAPGNDWVFAWAETMGAKTILYGSISGFYQHEIDLHGIPPESSSIPAWDNNYEGEMGLWERILNVYSTIAWGLTHEVYYLPRVEEVLRREGMFLEGLDRPLVSLVKDVGLTLINHHVSDFFAKALPPSVIPIGGLTLKESTGRLSEKIETFLNSTEDGFLNEFIYFSFGSAMPISAIDPKNLKVLFDAISATKLKYLWKWEGEFPQDAPKNIHFENWFSQLDVLAHPKIRGFITHGGHTSIQQAISNAVPLIVLPVNGDQDLNAKRIRVYENGIDLELHGLTSEELTAAINKIVEDPKYKAVSEQLRLLSRDRVMSPLDTAVWWTQFVLRNPRNITRLMKPRSIHQSWWQTRDLEVWAVIFLSLFTLLSGTLLFLVVLIKRVLTALVVSYSLDPKRKSD